MRQIDNTKCNASTKYFSLLILLITFIATAFLQSSCGISTKQRNLTNLKHIHKGMTKQDVLRVMGEPLRDEVYNTDDVWFYFTESKWSDTAITRDECTPLFFKNDVLLGWGQKEYKKYKQTKW